MVVKENKRDINGHCILSYVGIQQKTFCQSFCREILPKQMSAECLNRSKILQSVDFNLKFPIFSKIHFDD